MLVWNGDASGKYLVKLAYNFLMQLEVETHSERPLDVGVEAKGTRE